MWRISREIVEDNDVIRTERGEYRIFYNEDELKSYDDIKNNFKNFKLDEDYELELKEDGWQSITYLKFCLHNEKEEDTYLFLIKLEVSSMIDLEYELILLFSVEDELKKNILDIRGKYSIKLKYDTNFYKLQGLVNDYENEDEDEECELEIPPVLLSYPLNHCAICCEEKPNILNYPCLHLSQCEACNEKGKIIKCIICKEKIKYKIKI